MNPNGFEALTGVVAKDTVANGLTLDANFVVDDGLLTVDAKDVLANGLLELAFVGVDVGAVADGVGIAVVGGRIPCLFFHLL